MTFAIFTGLPPFIVDSLKGTILSPIIDCMKQGELMWTSVATEAFGEIKKRMTETPVP
jgi:hypothetical protein